MNCRLQSKRPPRRGPESRASFAGHPDAQCSISITASQPSCKPRPASSPTTVVRLHGRPGRKHGSVPSACRGKFQATVSTYALVPAGIERVPAAEASQFVGGLRGGKVDETSNKPVGNYWAGPGSPAKPRERNCDLLPWNPDERPGVGGRKDSSQP